MINKTFIIFFYLFITVVSNVYAQRSVKLNVEDNLSASETSEITGFVGNRLNLAYQNRILSQDVNTLVAPFHNRTETHCWQSEFWGKWFTSAVQAYRYKPQEVLIKKLDHAVSELLSSQTTEGYIGNYTADKRLEQWDIWGRKYCLLGLLDYYDLTKDKKSLEAARKLADHLMLELAEKNMLIVEKGNHRGMAATSILEPICLLYSRTGDIRYLNFAEEIINQWETKGPQLISKFHVNVSERFPKPANWWGWEQGQKAYEMMSCYEGLLELYRITGKKQYKQAVEATWENIKNTEINIAGSGSSIECWFSGKDLQAFPVKKSQETCVTATWIKLSQQLLRLTGEVKYADAIEQAYYNALLGAMNSDGSDWAKYSPLMGQRLTGEEQCGMGINCCVASGPRGLFSFPKTIIMKTIGGVQANFFALGKFSLHTPNNQSIQVLQETDYPVTGQVRIKIILPKPENFVFKIRIPSWSIQTELKVNNQIVGDIESGSFKTLNRRWENGDEIILSLDMRGRVTKIGTNPQYLAIQRGPILLARDKRLGGPDVDEAVKPVLNKDGFCDVEVVNVNKDNMWTQYKIPFTLEAYIGEGPTPVSHLLLCDYSSAGNTNTNESIFKVWLPQLIDGQNKK